MRAPPPAGLSPHTRAPAPRARPAGGPGENRAGPRGPPGLPSRRGRKGPRGLPGSAGTPPPHRSVPAPGAVGFSAGCCSGWHRRTKAVWLGAEVPAYFCQPWCCAGEGGGGGVLKRGRFAQDSQVSPPILPPSFSTGGKRRCQTLSQGATVNSDVPFGSLLLYAAATCSTCHRTELPYI